VRVHSCDYSYKCDHCPKKFHQKNNLLVHCLRRHGLQFSDTKRLPGLNKDRLDL
jgi:hypothetical protein